MIDLKRYEVWFVAGSQHLYGDEALSQVAGHAERSAQALSESELPVSVVPQPVVTTSEEITATCRAANSADHCIGIIAWMHTFSPARMWISGLRSLQKPLLHLHTQFNRDIPWGTIDMDFLNLNQSAHGGREFGFINARMETTRKIVVGHWEDPEVLDQLDVWTRAASAWNDAQDAKIARLGDNMRDVAVTEGDKVAAQIRLGYSVNGYGVGELAEHMLAVSDSSIAELVAEYLEEYGPDPSSVDHTGRESLREAAQIELGLRSFLRNGEFKAFTTTFENLHGLPQLPGLAVQRLMADGYGFGAEGDWKTAALVRAMKVMGAGLDGGTSFMEDYTYHLDPQGRKVLGAHMLEVCPSLAIEVPSLEVHPLGIGGKGDPARLVFDTPAGPGLNASLIDLGDRFRMIVNTVDVVRPDFPMPSLPMARAIWVPRPDLKTAASGWILAGGAHHSSFSMALTEQHIADFCDIAGIECLLINDQTNLSQFMKELRWNEVYYRLLRHR
jgi:L-arabinose isomerase